jgi:hypothetical protein
MLPKSHSVATNTTSQALWPASISKALNIKRKLKVITIPKNIEPFLQHQKQVIDIKRVGKN